MDGPSEVEGKVIAEFTLNDDHMMTIMHALDCYGYSLLISGHLEELERVKEVAVLISQNFPRVGLDS